MKFGDVKGSVTAKGFEEQIAVDSFSFGMGRAIGLTTGNSTSRETGTPSMSEITVTKKMDHATGPLLDASLRSTTAAVTLSFIRTENNKPVVYLQVDLEAVLISGVSIASEGDVPKESISLSYTKIEITPYITNKDNQSEKGPVVKYDLSTAEAG